MCVRHHNARGFLIISGAVLDTGGGESLCFCFCVEMACKFLKFPAFLFFFFFFFHTTGPAIQKEKKKKKKTLVRITHGMGSSPLVVHSKTEKKEKFPFFFLLPLLLACASPVSFLYHLGLVGGEEKYIYRSKTMRVGFRRIIQTRKQVLVISCSMKTSLIIPPPPQDL